MRNMSFSLTTPQMEARTKTQTRRLGWSFLQAGDVVRAVEKGMGLKKGEKVRALYPIRVTAVRRERLSAITQADVRREGFASSPAQFVAMFVRHNGCMPETEVNVIDFEETHA